MRPPNPTRTSFPRRFRRASVVLLAVAGLSVVVGGAPAGAETFTVDTEADTPDVAPGDGTCADASGACSLRAAVMEANARAGQDDIRLPAGTFRLGITGSDDQAAKGDLDLNPGDGAVVTIEGAGAGETILDGGGVDRVLHVVRGSAVVSALSIRNGSPSSGGGGGAFVGAAGSLSVTDVEFRGNSASDGSALRSQGSTGVARSLITANSGGAAVSSTTGGVTMANSTVSTNAGPGVRSAGGSVSLTHVTIADNGGAGVVLDDGSISLGNSVVAGNKGPECSPVGKVQARGFNVVEDGSCNLGKEGLPNASVRLRALRDNGGPTRTHLPASGSPAIDFVASDRCPVREDQREARRPHDGDGDGTARCDAGAVEAGAEVSAAAATTTTRPRATTTTTRPVRPVSGRPDTVG